MICTMWLLDQRRRRWGGPIRTKGGQIMPAILLRAPPLFLDDAASLYPVRDIKKRNHEFSDSPIREFKVLQNVFKMKKKGLKVKTFLR